MDTTLFAMSAQPPPANPADVMKAMFARRASQGPSVPPASQAPPEPVPTITSTVTPTTPSPTNPAEAMKAMFARRASEASNPPPSDPTPTNPAEAMKAMFARRAASSAPPAPQFSHPSPSPSPSISASASVPPPAPTPTPNDPNATPLKDTEEYKKYFKMLKSGLPNEVVKHAMTRDGKDPDILDNDPNKPLPPVVPLNKDPRFAKFFKMLKIHIPMPAVKQAMMKDGLDPYILDCPHDKPLPKVIPKPQAANKKMKMPSFDKSAPPLKDDPKFEKYWRMKKMGLPLGAVQNALAKDGHDPAIMEMDVNKSLSQNVAERAMKAGGGEASEAPKAPKRRRKKLDWKPIHKDKVSTDSIWAAEDDFNLDLDQDEFDSLFVMKTSPNQKSKKRPEEGANSAKKKKKASVQVISGKRGMNGGISLARIKVKFEDIAKAIDELDESVLSPEQLTSLKECLPDRDESYALSQFLKKNNNSVEELCEAEKFMVATLSVANAAEKIDALIFKAHFVHRRNDIIDTAKCLEVACDDVKMSLKLKKLLAIILKVGNQLNHGGNEAHAFTLESLLKLNQSKAFDRKTTILHYLVTLVKRNDATLLKFKDDISSIVRAEKIAFDQTVVEELKKLEVELKRVEKIALNEAEKIKNQGGGMSKLSIGELAGMKTSLIRTSSGNATVTHHDKALPIQDISLTPIGRFSVDASAALSDAQSYASKVSKKFRDVLRYFGEDNSLQPMQFFQTLSAFTRAFDAAHDDVVKEEKRKAREKRLQEMKAEREKKKSEASSLKHTTSPDKPKHKKISINSGSPPKTTGRTGRRATTQLSTPPNFGL